MESTEALNYLSSSLFPFELSLLIHECTYDADSQELAKKHGHSTSTMAGIFAGRVKAQTLALTHFSTRYEPPGVNEDIIFYSHMDVVHQDCPKDGAHEDNQPHAPSTCAPEAIACQVSHQGVVAPASPKAGTTKAASTKSTSTSASTNIRKGASLLGREALSAAQDLFATTSGGHSDICIICAEDFMNISGVSFRSVARGRCKLSALSKLATP
mmetsp:Transcript_35867/g.57827  ORF Transcript_35867/g.57827 Transcript_35867/m.57827 type:complete len:213 (+) Transcript_35867:37-675(+)